MFKKVLYFILLFYSVCLFSQEITSVQDVLEEIKTQKDVGNNVDQAKNVIKNYLNRTSKGFTPSSLPQIGYHPSGISYWSTPYFSNALYNGKWLEYADGEFGTDISIWNNPQFDVNGFPKYLNPDLKLRGILYGLHTDYGTSRPPSWPIRSELATGRVVLTWQGDSDIRLHGAQFISGSPLNQETGSMVNGQRVYLFQNGAHTDWMDIHAINPDNPVTDIKVWLSDPSNPQNQSLENQLIHPTFLERLNDTHWGFIRYMDFLKTNANPQQDWSDRRLPTHCFMSGKLNPRPPANGSSGNRLTGCAYEFLNIICNETNKDLWVCVPHLATDDYIYNLARLIRYGSDGVNPYTSPQTSPVYPPLNNNLRIYIEYSNEIWSNGYSFPQGDWAQDQASALGISKGEFNARRFCEVWRIFQEVFESPDRLVRVAAVFTANNAYTNSFLDEISIYGPTLTPQVEPDVIAVTTYFGNGIQDWVYEKSWEQVGTADPWFFTGELFDAGGGNMRPVSLPASDPYWLSSNFETHMEQAFDEWKHRMLSGDAREGAGPDAVGIGGGFDSWLYEKANTTFTEPVPLIAYEGGPSIYTNNVDGGSNLDDGITTFMEAMNRRPEMAEVYRMHLNMAKSKGLWSHVGFTDCGSWGRYGQWGHLEYLSQPLSRAVKYQFLLDWIQEQQNIRHIDNPLNNVPTFITDHNLPVAIWNEPYNTTIEVNPGDGNTTISLIQENLLNGIIYDPLLTNPLQVEISGTPSETGLSFVYLRTTDENGDPAWRTYTILTVGGPNTILECNFTGTNPALNLPWTSTYVLEDGLSYSGWQTGNGIIENDGDNAIVFGVNAPADEVDSTLALAIADEEYLSFTIQASTGETLDLRNAELSFTIRRIDYHCPRRYAVFCSIDGFTESNVLFDTNRFTTTADEQFTFNLPNTEAYNNITAPVEFRIVGYSGQWGNHKTSLIAFKLIGDSTTS